MSGQPRRMGFDPYDKTYGMLPMDARVAGSIRRLRLAAYDTYMDTEEGLHGLFSAVSARAAASKKPVTRPTVRGPYVLVSVYFPPIHFDPEPGNSDARRIIRLTRSEIHMKDEMQPGNLMVRDIVPQLNIYCQAGKVEKPDAVFVRPDLANLHRVQSGLALLRGSTDVLDVFRMNPVESSEVQRHLEEQAACLGHLANAAAALEMPLPIIGRAYVPLMPGDERLQ